MLELDVQIYRVDILGCPQYSPVAEISTGLAVLVFVDGWKKLAEPLKILHILAQYPADSRHGQVVDGHLEEGEEEEEQEQE